ncbi:hypothetical protein FALBO_15108 [Fusarium albosuccineum]|uniref:Uncharacterized protein n=1 Tax=Fusarium albosuccineum TaxID=1237068 RepID=A0A8H4KYR8_9HYPO|nr:hypothetical protein FALBO_15108 [Fusarium albosuccineum]
MAHTTKTATPQTCDKVGASTSQEHVFGRPHRAQVETAQGESKTPTPKEAQSGPGSADPKILRLLLISEPEKRPLVAGSGVLS